MKATPVSQEVLDRLLVPSTATLTSVLKDHGLNNTFMHRVQPLRPGMKMTGLAFTLRYIPAREDLNAGEMDNYTDVQRLGIEQIQKGDVLVIDARGDTRAGTMGSILAARMQVRGAAGVVTDGAYRDSPAIAESGMAAYASAMNAHTNKTIHYPSEIQVPIGCGGVAVMPGDIVVGDGEGVVIIPSYLAEKVVDKAEKQELKEEFILAKVMSGASIVDTYPPDDKTLAEFEEWKKSQGL
ncbi:MAG: ribonuclease activity regulator RraA [Candidatus Latescibacterota bacterium]|nr:ribonuclease activity regulator RraA [Candidatus Latescibacterota bacterium]